MRAHFMLWEQFIRHSLEAMRTNHQAPPKLWVHCSPELPRHLGEKASLPPFTLQLGSVLPRSGPVFPVGGAEGPDLAQVLLPLLPGCCTNSPNSFCLGTLMTMVQGPKYHKLFSTSHQVQLFSGQVAQSGSVAFLSSLSHLNPAKVFCQLPLVSSGTGIMGINKVIDCGAPDLPCVFVWRFSFPRGIGDPHLLRVVTKHLIPS